MINADGIVRAIRESEIDACLDLWTTAWPEAGRPYFARYFYGDHEFQPEYTQVCVADGRIVSAAQVVKRVVSGGEFTLTMGGIGNVATLPAYRRRGYSTRCLQRAIQVMESDAIDFSLLFTGIHALYEPLGWERAPSRYVVGQLNQEVASGSPLVPVRDYRAGDDEAIHRIYNTFNVERPGAVRRTAAYWRDWVGLCRGSFGGRAIVAELGRAVVGYCLYRIVPDRGMSRILELGWNHNSSDAVLALLNRAAADSRNAGVERMALSLHENSTIDAASKRVFARSQIEMSDSAMVRLLHRDNLLRGLAPALTMRWMEAGSPAGSLTFGGPYGAARIRSGGGFLKVEEVDDAESALGQGDLFQMLIGRGVCAMASPPAPSTGRDGRSAPNPGGGGAAVPADQVAFAGALFPRQEPWFWTLDGF